MKKFTQLNESKEEFDPKELEMGIKIESEHGDIYEELKKWADNIFKENDPTAESIMPWTEKEFYEKIAKAHLREIPDYYNRLTKMEKDAE